MVSKNIISLKRSRLIYFALIVITILCGLASRKFSSLLPYIIAEYAGDALWAMNVYFVAAFVFHKLSPWKVLIGALAFSYLIEISQLYQADWINAIRATTPGALILGFGFLWSDVICYTVGALLGMVIDVMIIRRNK